MSRRAQSIVPSFLSSTYRLLLLAYPAAFRRQVGRDMVEVFDDLCAHEINANGGAGLLRLSLRTVGDVTRNGIGERWTRRRSSRSGRGVVPYDSNPRSPRGDRQMNVFLRDLQFAVRTLRKQAAFSATVIFVLALGIAGTTGIFSVFNGLFLRPLPFENPDRLVNIDETAPQWNLEYVGLNYNDFVAWREQNQTFDAMAVFGGESFNVSLDGEVTRVDAASITHDIFDVLGIEPALGRRFTAKEDEPGAAGVVLIGTALWQDRFAADPGVLGKILTLDGEPYTVIGVLPPEAAFVEADLWVPLRADPTQRQGSWWLDGIGRLSAGVGVEEARLDLDRVHKGQIDDRPVNEITSPVVQPVLDRLLGDFRLGTTALLAGLSVVLLIACANVAGLMLARATSRTGEVGIRLALGAGRGRIMRQLLTESLLLATAGAALGISLGYGGLRAVLSAVPEDVPRWISFEMDIRFLLFTTALTAGSALLFGFAPAWRVARIDPQRILQSNSLRSSLGSSRRRGLSALVVGEIALALLLLISAGLFMAAFQKLQNVDPGFIADSVLSYRVSLPEATYEDGPKQRAFFESHLAALSALPGVVSVGATTHEPLGGHTGNFYQVEGAEPLPEGSSTPVTLSRNATVGYFDAIGINLLVGRTFTSADAAEDAPAVVVVNQAFAEYHWPGENPVGRRISYSYSGDEPMWMEVIGLTQDVKHYGLDEDMRPGVYSPYDRDPSLSMTIVARTAVDPLSIADEARALIREQDADLPIYRVSTMQQRLDESLWGRRAASWSFAIFAAVAMTLAISGIYGVVSYAVGQRTHEIGIRMALGARSSQVLGDVMRHGLLLLGIGVALGLGAAVFAARALSSLLFGVSATDPLVYAVVTLSLVGVAVLANLLPARRAASIDPMRALRDD